MMAFENGSWRSHQKGKKNMRSSVDSQQENSTANQRAMKHKGSSEQAGCKKYYTRARQSRNDIHAECRVQQALVPGFVFLREGGG
jgi:hypothetical protein